MSDEVAQQILAVFQFSLLLVGGLIFLWLTFNARQRTRWLGTNRLDFWEVTPLEFGVYVVLILFTGFFCQSAAQILLAGTVSHATDRAGMELFVYGLSFHGGALLGWLAFRSMREGWQIGNGAETVTPSPVPPPSWPKVLLYAGVTVLASLPVIIVLSLGWTFLLRQLGLPDDPQDSIAVFSNTKSAVVVAGMFAVACILAPLNEELLFRAGLFRFLRRRVGRTGALLLSGGIFGAVHLNWAGFLPLSALGVALAVAYEATGSIRVPIVAHGLFNLLNIFFIVSSQTPGNS